MNLGLPIFVQIYFEIARYFGWKYMLQALLIFELKDFSVFFYLLANF